MELYERYHAHRKFQKRVIGEKNFTYYDLIRIIKPHLSHIKNVLDVGCGTGTIDFYLAKKGIKVVGLDISKNSINIARENARHLGLFGNTKFVVSCFPQSKIAGKYDLIICSEVLEHLKDDYKSVAKIFRLLKPGGIALFSSPLRESVLSRLGLTKNFDKEVGHLRRYDVNQFTTMIASRGFKIVKIKKMQGLFRDLLFTFPIGNFIIRLANRFEILSDFLVFADNLLVPLGAADVIVLVRK